MAEGKYSSEELNDFLSSITITPQLPLSSSSSSPDGSHSFSLLSEENYKNFVPIIKKKENKCNSTLEEQCDIRF